MAGKFKENPEARKRRLEETITAPENDYDNDVAASTKYNDKYREQKLLKRPIGASGSSTCERKE